MNEFFRKFSQRISALAGTYWASLLAIGLILGWILSGPVFHYSNTWQLFINTTTTIITFLMVFIIQNTQNRETKATQLKLDELLNSSSSRKDNKFIDAEDMTDEQLEREKQKIIKHQIARNTVKKKK